MRFIVKLLENEIKRNCIFNTLMNMLARNFVIILLNDSSIDIRKFMRYT